jgi:hypothetical protein
MMRVSRVPVLSVCLGKAIDYCSLVGQWQMDMMRVVHYCRKLIMLQRTAWCKSLWCATVRRWRTSLQPGLCSKSCIVWPMVETVVDPLYGWCMFKCGCCLHVWCGK